MTITVHHDALVTVEDTFRRRRYGAHRRGALWFTDRGQVAPRIQRAIEAALKARS